MRYMKKGTEAIITAAQDQALRTNWIISRIHHQNAGWKDAKGKMNQRCIQRVVVKAYQNNNTKLGTMLLEEGFTGNFAENMGQNAVKNGTSIC